MNTLAYEQRDDAWGSPEDEAPLPRRPRPQLLNRRSATLLAVVTAAAGFYAGVRIEKGQVSGSSTTASSGGSALAAGLRSRLAGAAASGGTGSARAASGGFPGVALPGGAGGAGSAGSAGAGASFGTITTVNGATLYLSTTSGNTIKVTLSRATKITKSVGVKRASLRPGDTVIVRGITGSRGGMNAATVTDSGSAGAGSARSASASGSGSTSGSGSSAVGSLFSNPGGASGAGGG